MIYFFILAILLFSLRVLYIYVGLRKEKAKDIHYQNSNLPFISVIVPSRNEEKNIGKCLESLVESDYPKNKYEILAVNDRSDDNTEQIIKTYAEKYDNIKLINVNPNLESNNLKGKPRALQTGYDAAKGEYIMMTDADCIVNPNWIKTTASIMKNHDLDLMPSFTLISGNRWFDKIQSVEWIYLHTMASAGVGNNSPLGCYGNNLSINHNTYKEIGGYPKIKFSVTEDLALEQAVFNNDGKVHYRCDKNTTVTTLPVENFSEYLKQKKRWAVGGLGLGWKATYFVLASLSMWTAIILSIIFQHWLWLGAIGIIRILGDYVIIEHSIKKLEKEELRKWTIPSIIFFTIMELIVPFTLLTGKVQWKGQKF
jgi:1,2-diacylglycerol 3-beta-glucosyltransferase